jgi:hypothetical protein
VSAAGLKRGPQNSPPRNVPIYAWGGYSTRAAAKAGAVKALRKRGFEGPKEPGDFRITREASGYRWNSATPAPVSHQIPPSPANDHPRAEPPRQATLEQNRRIRAFLDDAYDEEAGRYYHDGSDAKAAEMLKVPRAWVTTIRELYGPDQNDGAAKRRAELDAAHAEAVAASARFLELAQEAEALAAKLAQARKVLG